jgi:hypothetical protein
MAWNRKVGIMGNRTVKYRGMKGYYTLRFSEKQQFPEGVFGSVKEAKDFAYVFHFGKPFKVAFVPDGWIFSERRYARPGE